MDKLKHILSVVAIAVTFGGCQRQIQSPPPSPQCAPGEVAVGNVCTRDPAGGRNDSLGRGNEDGRNTSDSDYPGLPNFSPSPRPEEITPEPSSTPLQGRGEPSASSPAPTPEPELTPGGERPGAVTNNEDRPASEGGTVIDPKTVASLKDLQIYVSMKSVAMGEKSGPMVLFVKASQPASIDELAIYYNAGAVLEGESAYDPWDINAKIEFKSGSNFCLVSETQFDWASYRPSEEGMGKSVPFSCKSK